MGQVNEVANVNVSPRHANKAQTAAHICFSQVKDRNDGNLLITRDGHIVHIDFGFMLSNTPGDMAFEQAPFKLTSELVAV